MGLVTLVLHLRRLPYKKGLALLLFIALGLFFFFFFIKGTNWNRLYVTLLSSVLVEGPVEGLSNAGGIVLPFSTACYPSIKWFYSL